MEENIKKNKLILSIRDYALSKNKLYFSMEAPVKMEEDFDSEANLTLKGRDGIYCSDIDGYFDPQIKDYFSGNISSFKSAWDEFGFFRAFKFLSLKTPWSNWAWCIDSRESMKFTISRHKEIESKEDFETIYNNIKEEDVDEYLEKNYLKLSDNLFVESHDSTCFVYDERKLPFALKDGWNKAQLEQIMSEWFYYTFNKQIKSQLI